jgi:hypothetical protein
MSQENRSPEICAEIIRMIRDIPFDDLIWVRSDINRAFASLRKEHVALRKEYNKTRG